MLRRIALVVLALVPLRGASCGDEPAIVPFPKDGLDEPFAGILGLPREIKDGNGDLHRRTAKPTRVLVGSSEGLAAEFQYPYADAAVEKEALAAGRAVGIRLVGFFVAGLAHGWLLTRFTARTDYDHEFETPVRPWNDGIARTALPGLFFRFARPAGVGLRGIVRHTAIDVDWDRRPSVEDGGEKAAAIDEMRTRVNATAEEIIRVVREAPAAESSDACHVGRVMVEWLGEGRLGISKYRLRASARASSDKKWLPATMWVSDGVYTNVGASGPTGLLTADFTGFDQAGANSIFCVDEGDVFRLFRLGKFRDHPMGYVWP